MSDLQFLKDQQFSDEEELLNLVKRQLGDEQLARYQNLIVKYAKDHLTFSARSESDEDEMMSVEEFLFKEKIGGPRLFSQAAALLFRSAGIPARMAGGYYYPASQDEVKAELLLTDAHATYWPEVYLRESGWVPVRLNPKDIRERPASALEHDLEQLLSQVARA